MALSDEWTRTRKWQATLANLAAEEAEILNNILDELHKTRLPLYNGTAEEMKAADEQLGIPRAFDRMNAALKRINEGRGHDD